jgi:SAM-dependent methyltransferase
VTLTSRDVIRAWDEAPLGAIHPSRGISEDAYWQSGEVAAAELAEVLPAGCSVVDFGCGDGRVAVPLRALGYDVTGADSSPMMLARITGRDPGMPVVQSNGRDLAEKLGYQVDAVFALAVLIHHDRRSVLKIIDGLRAAVKPGGLLILDWPVSDFPEERQLWIDVTTWAPEVQLAEARARGLTPVEPGRPWSVFRVGDPA